MAVSVALLLIFSCCMGACSMATAKAAGGFDDVPTVSFSEGFTPLFGESNLDVVSGSGGDGSGTVRVTLDRHTGSGFISKRYFHHGLFSADVRLPGGHTAGVVVAFYLSNGDVFPDTHDELDFEFLGNRAGHRWRMQTNVYGNGSTARGREERYLMPFDPSKASHRFSLLWSSAAVVFFVDGTPVREVPRHRRAGAGAGDYPSKPMAVYVTIWDGSTWATENGKHAVDYRRGPFTAEFSRLVLRGCHAADDATSSVVDHRCAARERELTAAAVMTTRKRAAMRRWRWKQTLYTVCYDTDRYPAALPECDVNAVERDMFERWGESKVAFRSRQMQSRVVESTPLAPPSLVSMMQAD